MAIETIANQLSIYLLKVYANKCKWMWIQIHKGELPKGELNAKCFLLEFVLYKLNKMITLQSTHIPHGAVIFHATHGSDWSVTIQRKSQKRICRKTNKRQEKKSLRHTERKNIYSKINSTSITHSSTFTKQIWERCTRKRKTVESEKNQRMG